VVLAQLHLEPVINSTVIFSPHPAYLAPGNKEQILYDPRREVLFRRVEDSAREFQCLLLTMAFRQGKLRRFVPARPLSPWQKQHLVQWPEGKDSLAGLKQLALQVTETFDADDWVGRARALEAFLKDSGRFSYTLHPPARSPGVDPIEDFLLCEYFASALVLMLRACAALGSSNRPPGGVRRPGRFAGTAGDEEQLADTFNWDSLLAYVRMIWTQYIVRMDARRQRNLLMELFFYWEFTPRGERLRLTRFSLVLLGLVLGGLLLWLIRRWNLLGRLVRVVDCYYQVRFGNRSLSEQETRRLEELVLRLDHALQNGNGSA